MARIIPNIPPLNDFVQNGTSQTVDDIGLFVGKAFRAKIIADRYTRGFEKAETKGPPGAFETSGLSIFETEKRERERRLHESRMKGQPGRFREEGDYTYEPVNRITVENFSSFKRDVISIVDIDYDRSSRKELRGYSSINLPFVPRELNYEPSSKFVGIATMGRNNPHYHFTGSEDSLQFDIEWFSGQNDRKDVINACRWIEALTKADSYFEAPHRVKLIWGQSDLLFRDHIWLVTEAPYQLTNFVDSYREKRRDTPIKVGLLPQQALQKITLKRVTTHNLTSFEILNRL